MSRRRVPVMRGALRLAQAAGFTLLELIIVLVLLAAIASMAWPRIMPTLLRSAPRAAALQLRRDLAEAREEAIRRGETWVFRYQVDTPQYLLAPATAPQPSSLSLAKEPDSLHGARQEETTQEVVPSDAPADTDALPSQTDLSDHDEPHPTTAAPDYPIRALPDGVVFRTPTPPWKELTQLRSDQALQQEEGELIVAEEAQLVISAEPQDQLDTWTVGSEFLADGRARDADVELHSVDTPWFVQLHIRGLTGSLTIGQVQHEATNDPPNNSDPPNNNDLPNNDSVSPQSNSVSPQSEPVAPTEGK